MSTESAAPTTTTATTIIERNEEILPVQQEEQQQQQQQKQQQEEQILLACEVPENVTAGEVFHVKLNERHFEVQTPEGVVPGQTVHIIVPAQGSSFTQLKPREQAEVADEPKQSEDANPLLLLQDPLDKIKGISDRTITHAKNLNDTYHIYEKLSDIAVPAIHQLKVIDTNYKITELTLARVSELNTKYSLTDRFHSLFETCVSRAQQSFDKIDRVVNSNRILAMAVEIDAKYTVTARAARVVDSGADILVNIFNKAVKIDEDYQISDRLASVVAAGIDKVTLATQKYGLFEAPEQQQQ